MISFNLMADKKDLLWFSSELIKDATWENSGTSRQCFALTICCPEYYATVNDNDKIRHYVN